MRVYVYICDVFLYGDFGSCISDDSGMMAYCICLDFVMYMYKSFAYYSPRIFFFITNTIFLSISG